MATAGGLTVGDRWGPTSNIAWYIVVITAKHMLDLVTEIKEPAGGWRTGSYTIEVVVRELE